MCIILTQLSWFRRVEHSKWPIFLSRNCFFLFFLLSIVYQTKTKKKREKISHSTTWFRLLCLYTIAKLKKEEISFSRFATGRNETDYPLWSNKSCSVIFRLQIWSQQNILFVSTPGQIVNCSNHVIFGAIKHTHKTENYFSLCFSTKLPLGSNYSILILGSVRHVSPK